MTEPLLISLVVIVLLILYLNRERKWSKGIATLLFGMFMVWGCAKTHPVQTKEISDFFNDLGSRLESAYCAFYREIDDENLKYNFADLSRQWSGRCRRQQTSAFAG